MLRPSILLESAPMRISYAVSYEAFVALQPPFVPQDPPGRGLFFFFQFAGALAGIGFMLLAVRIAYLLGWSPWPSAPLPRALAELALGGLPILGIWIARRRSARSTRRQHDEFLRDQYTRLHCREQRFVEVTEEGLVFGCDCKTAMRPWNLLTALVETPLGFVVSGGRETQVIPNNAFADEAGRTEFRALLSEKLNQDKTLSARTLEIECTREDWHNAGWLAFRVGGWVRAATFAFMACAGVGMILYFGPFVDYDARFDPPFVAAAAAFVTVVAILILVFRRKPVRYLGPLKISFAEDAIYVQSPTSESRIPWHHVTGCMIDKKCLILTSRSFGLLLIPGRFITPTQGKYILEILREKLTRGRGALAGPETARPDGQARG
jgi:hypothetical protein